LRLLRSIRLGTVTASMTMGKLANYPRQNGHARALREVVRIEKILFTLRWLHEPDLRRRVTAGLNKAGRATPWRGPPSSTASASPGTGHTKIR